MANHERAVDPARVSAAFGGRVTVEDVGAALDRVALRATATVSREALGRAMRALGDVEALALARAAWGASLAEAKVVVFLARQRAI